MSDRRLAPVDSVTGPVPPIYAEELEQAVLAAVMLDSESAAPVAFGHLTAESFYLHGHRALFRAMQAIVGRGERVDPLNLVDELQRADALEDAGGKNYIGFLVDAVPTAANVDYHARIVARKAKERALAEDLAGALAEVATGRADASTVARSLTARLLDHGVAGAHDAAVFQTATLEVHEHAIAVLAARGDAARSGRPLGVLTGWRAIDEKVHGFRPGELVIVGAGPKVGKSLFVGNILLNNVKAGVEGAIVTAEMTLQEQLERIYACEAEVHFDRINSGLLSDIEQRRIATHAGRLVRHGAPLHVLDIAFPELDVVLTAIRRLKQERPATALVIVDYLQLVTKRLDGRRGDEELAHVCAALKAIAKALELVVIAPAQLNYKDTDKRGDGRPRLHDFQGGSAMAQTANFPLLLWRPALHNPAENDHELRVILDRARRVGQFEVSLRFEPHLARIADLTFPAAA